MFFVFFIRVSNYYPMIALIALATIFFLMTFNFIDVAILTAMNVTSLTFFVDGGVTHLII